jgi:hypothetical protein
MTAIQTDKHTNFRIGERVVMKSFNGTPQPTERVKSSENYWLLVGRVGVIVKTWREADFEMTTARFLIKFDECVKDLGLHCHNEIENSLWILSTDIESVTHPI